MKLIWHTKTLDELSTLALFNILKLRQSVFVVEQQCAYPDIDDTDSVAQHLCGYNESGELLAYARLIKPGVSYPEASIGRVVIAANARGVRLGEALMQQALSEMDRLYSNQVIKIGAQEHLEKFYTRLGFERSSAMYMEDGIAHIHMLRA